jgi:hypothetical protein
MIGQILGLLAFALLVAALAYGWHRLDLRLSSRPLRHTPPPDLSTRNCRRVPAQRTKP